MWKTYVRFRSSSLATQDYTAPSAISSADDVYGPLPLKVCNSSINFGHVGSAAQHILFVAITQKDTDWIILSLVIILTIFASCYCYTGYDMFQGFNVDDIRQRPNLQQTTTTSTITSVVTNLATTIMPPDDSIKKINQTKCLEEERPLNIGSFEVPTQRDIVSMMKTMLTKSFSTHYHKVLTLIKNMKQATRASQLVENRCEINNILLYRKCIDQVRSQSEIVIQNLMVEVEHQKMAVAAVTEEKICNLSLMKTDPLELIITLAQENVSVQFALPGFLRSLSACSYYCSQ